MGLRNDAGAYGSLTKALHWLTVLAIVAQFVVGYLLEDESGRGRGRGRGRGGDEDDDSLGMGLLALGPGDDDRTDLLLLHACLGLAILALATVRLLWRVSGDLPAWAPGLSAFERRLEANVEKLLYLMLFLIPISGLLLLFGSGEDWNLNGTEWESPVEFADDDLLLGVHITTHIAFFVVVTVHLGLVLKHTLIDRDRLLRRML